MNSQINNQNIWLNSNLIKSAKYWLKLRRIINSKHRKSKITVFCICSKCQLFIKSLIKCKMGQRIKLQQECTSVREVPTYLCIYVFVFTSVLLFPSVLFYYLLIHKCTRLHTSWWYCHQCVPFSYSCTPQNILLFLLDHSKAPKF